MTAAVISFEHVGVDYGAQRRALDDVSLQSQAGEFLAIVGPSGSGKTTLLRLINRLADPTSGIVKVNGEDIRNSDPIALRRHIG
ncbi:MAG: ATP-binding cassette domain-containing protein, partial [Xanthobacteraceae bacterium]